MKASLYRNLRLVSAALSLGASGTALAGATLDDLNHSISKQQWNEAVEISQEILGRSPTQYEAKLKEAYALFQKGYSNSALLVLKSIPRGAWSKIPQGGDRLGEIVLLFQKKVPLSLLPARIDELSVSEDNPMLRDEIRFGRGRQAFLQKQYGSAREHLEAIPKNSRYFAGARYLLGSIAIQSGDYKLASSELAKVFEPAVLDQNSEFWNDLSAQMTSHWGANLRVELDSEGLTAAANAGELALLGLGRISYATRDYASALAYYGKIAPASRDYPRAQLEKVWTLLQMNDHERAQKEAAALSVNVQSFESFEAKPLRALILTDAGRTEEARAELDSFFGLEKTARKAMEEFRETRVAAALPEFLKSDLTHDLRLKSLSKFGTTLDAEEKALRAEDAALFPVYGSLLSQLGPLKLEAAALERKLTDERVDQRLKDLDRLSFQAKLIRVETFLEDRERLRAEFKAMPSVTEVQRKEHDERLAALLASAVDGADALLPGAGAITPQLKLRQSELLWELATAQAILDQGAAKKRFDSDALKRKSVRLAEELRNDPDALFFSGFARIELDDLAQGKAELQRYLAEYPRHAYAPDAHRIVADLEFDSNRFASAEASFRKILEFPDSPVVGYALYKIGWCAYNEKNFAKALLAFEKAVLWSGSSDHQSQSLNLRHESRHDLISVYGEVGDHQKASEYFRRFYDGDEVTGAKSWLAELAKVLDEMGQYEKSASLYRTLVSLSTASDPRSPDAIGYRTALIQGAFRLRQWPVVVREMEELVRTHLARLAKPQTDASLPESQAEQALRVVTLAGLKEFKLVGEDAAGDENFARVKKIDELYLQAFSGWPTSEEPLYRHARFLLDAKKKDEAVAAYRTHWNAFKGTLQEPLREESLRNLIYALDQVETANPAGASAAKSAPTETAVELLTLTSEYEQKYGKEKYGRPVAYLRSALRFKYAQLEDGLAESQKIFDADPSDDIGKRAFKNLRYGYYQLKNWERTYRWSSSLLARNDAKLKPYEQDLKAVEKEALFLWAENTRDDVRAAELYGQIATHPDMSSLREKSLYNSFIRLRKAGRVAEALKAADTLEKNHPDFGGLKQIAGVRAEIYQDAGDYERALPLLESFLAARDESVPAATVAQARLNAALMAEALDQDGRATSLYREYLKQETGRTPAGESEAKRGLQRVEARAVKGRESAFAGWAEALKKKVAFEKEPVPRQGELAARIQKGGARLEQLAKELLAIAQSDKAPIDTALEAYCALPSIYGSYARAVAGLGGDDRELERELAKVASPVEDKARELATQCIARSNESWHDGSLYREANARWGWQKDAQLQAQASEVFKTLEAGFPYFDPSATRQPSAAIIGKHIESQSSDLASRYSLALARLDERKAGLSRLTLVDALSRFPDAGILHNALTSVDVLRGGSIPVSAFERAARFENAAKLGSKSAWANLAYLNFKSGRLEEGVRAYKRAVDAKVLAGGDAGAALIARFPAPDKEQKK
jgi:TolA-binding protein